MRQIKNFMEAKRPMWNCNECKCITMQCWKDNGELCNCGTSSAPALLTYSELVALGTAEAILAELNTNDEGYYASLTTEGHIFQTTPEGATVTVAAIAEVVGQTQETTVPLVVDGGVFIYMVEGTPGEGSELHTWYWGNM